MQKLNFDTGIREYEVNGGACLRFNPLDPNVYNRFFAASEEISALEEEFNRKISALDVKLDEKGFPVGARDALTQMRAYDSKVKAILTEIFGAENDFDRILGGVNLLAITETGESVLTNFFTALAPIFQNGAEEHTKAAVSKARLNREQRRALL